VAAILSSPKTFMGAAVIDFSASAGWNSETSTCSVNLVEDPQTAGATHFDPANPGTAYIFSIGNLEFGGILQQWTENVSVGSGKTFSVSLNSPTTALEGSQVIMNSYEGLIPIHNVFNPFGARENYAYGGIFGGAFTNSAGYPWGVLLQDIQNLVNNNYAGGAFGGQYIRLGETLFKIDLSEISQLAGGLYWYRVSGTTTSLLAVIKDVCEAASADFMVQLVGGDPDPVTGVCTTPPTIKIRVIPRQSSPTLGVLTSYINQAESSGILVNKQAGLEFGDTTTSKMVFGGPQSRMWENYSAEFGTKGQIQQTIRPVWDIQNGVIMMGDHYHDDGKVYVRISDGNSVVPGNPFYECTILELRCAMVSREAWEVYAARYNPTIHNLFQSGEKLQSIAAPTDVIVGGSALGTRMNNGSATSLDVANTSRAAAVQWAITTQKGIQETIDKIYESIKRTADEYYGKKFFVAIPFEPGGFSNNVKFLSEDMDAVSAWEISNSAWVEPKPIADISYYDGEGRLKPYAFYPYGSEYNYTNITDNYYIDGLAAIVNGNPIGGSVVVKDINIEEDIHWEEFVLGGLPYVLCTVPKVTKEDKFSVKKGLASLYKNAPVSYIINEGPHSTGFGADTTNFKVAEAAIMPTAVGVAQQSTRHVYGPWWNQGSLSGRAEVENDGSLKPETFGSTALMNAAGITKAFATTMNLQNSESGEIEVAELPTIGLAEQIGGNGPYLSQISVSMSTSQVTTKYRFETWTLDFGKLAKYNIDRISRINKNTMKFLQEMREKSKNPPLGGRGTGAAGGKGGGKDDKYGGNSNQMLVADYVQGSPTIVPNVVMQPLGTTMTQINKNYNKKFAMSHDGLFRPFVTRRVAASGVSAASGVALMIHETGILPSGAHGKFTRENIYPTESDLNPLFAGNGEHDIQAIARDKTTKDLNIRKGGYAKEEYRGIGLRGPLIVTGWGYDVYRDPVPPAYSGVNLGFMGRGGALFESFLPDHMRKSQEWKSGPVEMYWDDVRNVWATRWEMIECRLVENLNGPDGVQNPTQAEALVLGSDGMDTGESIILENRDPSLHFDYDSSTHRNHAYCIAIRIGGTWRPIYIGCAIAPDGSAVAQGSLAESPASGIQRNIDILATGGAII
tara:strand:- start:1663 stop:5052 length:3390 start_codon:yes stop_codon:yes gene_type:complete